MNRSSKPKHEGKTLLWQNRKAPKLDLRPFRFLMKSLRLLLVVLPLIAVGNRVQAQSITPAADGTDTLVTPDGNRIDIGGGQTSRDGANLFHSFEKFGLNQNEIANFLSRPEIQNILGRVVGGEASLINGLLQVSGGNSNLFLMNPAGIIFGSNASLNLPADFAATTANGIGFGANWFNAAGENNYAVLMGNPTAFAFTMGQPGTIINAGNLNVTQGHNLTLAGGTVVSTGQLSGPGGQITVTAVPGTNMVRLSQPGNLLSLDIPITPSSSQPNAWTVPIASLPELLTGRDTGLNLGLQVNPNKQAKLVHSGMQIPTSTGTTIVSGTIDAANTQPGNTGGVVQVLGDKVGMFGAKVNASGTNGGGTVLIGGDYKGQGTVPTASRTYVTGSTIAANALQEGNGGEVIVWADGGTGFYGSISAHGGTSAGNGGFVEVSGKQRLTFRGSVDTSAPNGNTGTLLLDPADIIIENGIGDGGPGGGDYSNTEFFGNPSGNAGQVSNTDSGPTIIYESELEGTNATNIILQASNGITIRDLNDNLLDLGSRSITFTAGGTFTMGTTVPIELQPEPRQVSPVPPVNDTIQIQGGAVTISGTSITAGNIVTSAPNNGNAGNITLTSTNGNTTVGFLRANSINPNTASQNPGTGRGGIININASGLFQTTGSFNDIDDNPISISTTGQAGSGLVTITAGSINTSIINSFTNSSIAAGLTTLTANSGNLITRGINTNGPVNVSSSGTFQVVGPGFTLGSSTDRFSIDTVGRPIDIQAAAIQIPPQTLIRASNSDVTLRPRLATAVIGVEDATQQFNLTDTLLDAVVARNLTIGDTANTGGIRIEGDVTQDQNLRFVTSGNTQLNGSVSTTGQDITISSNAVLGDNATVSTGTGAGNILFEGTINSVTDEANDLPVNAGTGNITFTGAVGNSAALGAIAANSTGTTQFNSTVNAASLATNPGGQTQLNGNVTTSGNQTYGDAVTLGADTALTTNNATVAFGNTVNGTTANQESLTVNSNATFAGAVGNSTIPLEGVSVTGTSAINGGAITTAGNQTYNGAVTLGADTALTTNNATVAFGNTVNSTSADQESLQVNSNATFAGAVGNSTPLEAVSVAGTSALNGGAVTTAGSQTYTGAVTLGSPETNLTDTGTSGILFNNTVNSDATAPRSLTVNANNGAITFGTTVGDSAPLANLTTTSRSLNQPGNVTTTGSVVFAADDMRYSTGNITSGLVTLQPQTTGQGINLGGADADGTLGLTSAQLNRVIAERLQVGSSNSGDLTVTAPIAPTRTSTLSLISGGTITQAAGINVPNLRLASNGSITLNGPGNDVDVLAAQTDGANFSYIDSNNLALGTVDGISGITTAGNTQGGNINLSATAIDTIGTKDSGPLNASATNGNAGNVTLTSTQGDIEVSSINTQSDLGRAGNVTINSNRYFRALSTFPTQGTNASISVVGGSDQGSININQAGGSANPPVQPFIIGDETLEELPSSNLNVNLTDVNGTAGALVGGIQGINGNEINVVTNFPGSTIRGLIRINTDDPVSVFENNTPPTVLVGPDPTVATSSLATLPDLAQCREFEQYFGDTLEEFSGESGCNQAPTAAEIRRLLSTIAVATGKKTSIIYISPEAQEVKITAYFAEGAPVTKNITETNRSALRRLARKFRNEVAPFVPDPVTSEDILDVTKLKTTSYLASSQELYKSLIAPIEADLKAQGIDTLVLSVGTGLRSLPWAALHDGKQFLVEKYSIGLIPSLNLTDTRYESLQKSQILAMGASTFTDSDLPPLPAVPVEIRAIIQNPWQGESFLNENFTVNKLTTERQEQTFKIVHLATHAVFQPGNPSESFIQLGNQRLGLDQLRQLQLDKPKVELLILSACQTAVGDQQAELGFAGVALAAGVRTAMGSLWTVSDVGTLGLMTEFYRQLSKATVKAEALRQAQLAMLKGQVRLQGNQLIGPTGQIPLPPDTAKLLNAQFTSYQGIKNLGHPYFWSAFTMIGNPW